MTRRIRTVFFKEVIDNLRDRKSLSTAFVFTLIGPLVLAGSITITAKVQSQAAEKPISLPTQGAINAPGLIAYLKQHNVIVTESKQHLESMVKRGDCEVAMSIAQDFGKNWRTARPATVRLFVDESKNSAHYAFKRIYQVVSAYGATIGKLRLLARGLDPSITDGVAIETVDVSTPESLAAMLLGMLPYFIIVAIFLGGYYIVVDATASELERGSLEPLFINPVARWEFLLGKFSAAFTFSLLGLAVALFGFWLIPQFVSTEGLGISIRLDGLVLIKTFFLVLPLTALATAIGMVVATLSKSYKEAQTMLSILMIVPIIPGLLLALAPFKTQTWMMFVPILSEQILINELIRGNQVRILFVVICAVMTTVVAVASMFVAIRLYSGERVFAKR